MAMGEKVQQTGQAWIDEHSQSSNASKVDHELHESLLVNLIIRVLSRMV